MTSAEVTRLNLMMMGRGRRITALEAEFARTWRASKRNPLRAQIDALRADQRRDAQQLRAVQAVYDRAGIPLEQGGER